MSVIVILKLMLVISIALMLFALALRARVADLGYLFVHWRLGLGAFAAMFVVVPVVAILLARTFDLNPAVKVALVAIAFSPLPPILPGKQIKAGGEACYVTGLLFAATLASIVVAPFGIAFAASIFDVEAAITPMAVAMPLIVTVLAPLLAGLALSPMFGTAVSQLSPILSKIGTALLVLAVLGLVVMMLPGIRDVIGQGTLVVLCITIAAGMVAGYFFGGPERGDKAALSLAAATRHPGVAVAIATQTFPAASLAPAAIVLSLVLSTVLCIPYLRYMGKQPRKAAA
ncbi:hypothetical protein [Novosphingobium album (ex Hu et al. 2023)]|uniref:Na+-dependent transporter n=1 Tax=Novosphingobium album (ex Hu et al. 2023) TaxID=2930093 RepID=A0ABT0AZY1_9SPHN|nr:hypothetical protein [Novosphingobium album (ex Hu et al. 2023)]MCJ2178376.1 hypothetical protein [Novosphingobium album (ex Hu et al. 2023)]